MVDQKTSLDSPPEPETEYLHTCYRFIEVLVKAQDLPKSVENAAKHMVSDVPGKIRQHYQECHLAGAALHLESRRVENSYPRTVKQIATSLEKELQKQSHLSNKNQHAKKIRRAVKKLKEIGDLDLDPELAEAYLPYILDRLDLDREIRERAWTILEIVEGSYELQSKSKIGVASAIVYLSTSDLPDRVTASELRELVNRNEKTIRDRAEEIQRILKEG